MRNLIPLTIVALVAASLGACSREPAAIEPHDEPGSQETEIPHTQPMPGIETVEAGPRQLQVMVSTYGTLVPNAERTRNVSARFAGIATRVFKAAGDRVVAGETLLTVESNESLQIYAVKSPIAGIVTARNVNPGETVESQALFTVSDLSTLWAELMVFPREIGKVRAGQRVTLRSGDGSLATTAQIAQVSPIGTADTQAITVRVPVANTDGRWRPGLNVAANIVVAETQVDVAVQSTALQTVDGARVVFVPHEGGFTPRAVQTGQSDDEFVEIVSGLAAGERYVATDSFLVKADLEKAGAEHEH
jgi:cobalt-zinc-cadmium efflux system membrane fusion protein